MFTTNQRAFLLLFLGLLLGASGAVAQTTNSALFANGDLEASRDGQTPSDWALSEGVSWGREANGNHFLHLQSPRPGAHIMAYRAVTLTPGVGALELSYKVRYQNIKRGKQSWFDGRIMMNFKDAAKQVLQPGPPHPSFSGTALEWKERTHQFKVPPGATTLELMFTLFQAESGELDFDDVRLTPIAGSVVEAAETAARAKEVARIAALPKPKPQVPVPPADKLPKELHVAGNQLQTADGATVWLQGVAIPSMEWSAGEHILPSVETALTEWKANCIRLPVREHFWAGTGPYQRDGGMKYRQLVEDAINLCAAHQAYLVIDLHDYRAPRDTHAAFWKDVAARYKNHPAVLFELLNEPHDISWELWRGGGKVTDKPKKSDAVAENKQALVSFDTPGMQQLVDLVRAAGAKNIIIAGGLDWGYDLSGVLQGFALQDRTGNGIMYSSHVYPWKHDWQHKFLDAAARYPLFVGEVGADAKPMEFIPRDQQEAPATWVPDILGVIQQHKLNWTAWCFHPDATPRVLLDWNYTPTPFWGVPVKEALAGKRFEVKRLR